MMKCINSIVKTKLLPLFLTALFFAHSLNASVYVATNGDDANAGTIDAPFNTITKAVSVLAANDTIFVRGGTYVLTATISISKRGNAMTRYYLFAYPGERPLLDFSGMAVSSSNRGINFSGAYWHVKGLDIKGAGDNGMNLSGSNNIIEFCSFFENRDTGLQLSNGASNNQIINCDSYFNADPSNGNADGFAPKLDVGSNNYFYGCRAWQNSDDGWDGYLRESLTSSTILENCWSFRNGYLKNGSASSGNGNGFKMGGGDSGNSDSTTHNMILRKCLAFDNRVKGFDQNNNRGSMTLLNCSGYRNGINYGISAGVKFGEVITVKNSVVLGSLGALYAGAVQEKNSWLAPFTVTDDDFISVDTTGISGARKPDGSLPDVDFLHLAAGSDLIDAGVNVGLPFIGSAPDLGAFESPMKVVVQDSASVVWPLTNPSSGGTGLTAVTSGQVLGVDESFTNSEINGYTGFNNSQRVRIIGNTWPLNQTGPIDTVYVQFAAKPKTGITFTVTSIKLLLSGSGGSNMRAKVFYSKDSTFTTKTEFYSGTTNLTNATSFDTASASLTEAIADSQSLYIRIYPWLNNQTSGNTGKYVTLQNLVVTGATNGIGTIDLPVITTASAFNVSTTFAFSGGNISSDGGSAVTQRGVCWNTTGNPTLADSTVSSRAGSGAYVSFLDSLQPATKYYARSFATNAAGTSYGSQITFTTLTSLSVPALTTTAASKILVATASSGGNVTAWGGDTVDVRGVCWNTTGTPAITDNKTENGTGVGSFTSVLAGLAQNTTYYVRAYATNSIGTGYGNQITFKTQIPAADVKKVVAKDGSGDYLTVQEAFNAVPDNYTGRYIIYVKKGTYKEKLLLAQNKINVILVGQDRDSTILTYDDYAGKAGGTSNSYSVAIEADDFTAMNITFQNTVKNDGSFSDQQAVALRVNGDRQAYFDCTILGYQDTYYTWGGRGTGRTYHKNNLIEGSVDFIFGRNIVVFDSCTIKENRNNGTLTAASTEASSKFGYVFMNSKIVSDATGFDGNPITTFYLGRPWQAAPRTVFLNSEEPANLNSAGWLAWNVAPALYAEYNGTGDGFKPAQRVAWSSQLTDSAAATYTIENIFSRNSVTPAYGFDWIPVKPDISGVLSVNDKKSPEVPRVFHLAQNFPNPFNPSTTIQFTVAERGFTTLKVFNTLGQEVAQVFTGEAEPGKLYSLQFNAASLASGLYFTVLESNNNHAVKKIMLLK